MDRDLDPAYARRVHDLLEPLCLVAFFAPEPSARMLELGLRDDYWDGYFAGRAAPLGRTTAEVVDAAFYSFAPGEVARHVPRVWEVTSPEAATAARTQGCAEALRRILGSLADSPAVDAAADLLGEAARSASASGRVVFAAHLALPVPAEPVARLWHTANLLREHRGDGHVAALLAHGIGRTEAHVLLALDLGMAAAEFGRLHHLRASYLDGVLAGMRRRGLVTDDGGFTPHGRETKESIERLTDELALEPYRGLTDGDRDRLVEALTPLSAAAAAAGSR